MNYMDETKYRPFHSVDEFLKECKTYTAKEWKQEKKTDWYGGQSWKECFKQTTEGDITAVDEANKILEQIDSKINMDGITPKWRPSHAGGRANVPAYLANAPQSMFKRVDGIGKKRAVNIYYAPCVSSGVKSEEIFKRGVLVLALAMQLGRFCDVNLHYISCNSTYNHTIKLASPLVLSECAHMITNTGVLRHLSFGLSRTANGSYTSWATWMDIDNPKKTAEKMRKYLKLNDDDIVIPPMHLNEWRAGGFDDPVKYINSIIEKYK